MLIALNIVMAGLVVIGIVTLLAKSISTENRTSTTATTVPANANRNHGRSRTTARPMGAQF